jgi:transcriptional regulator with XRE-family HTH domain
MAEPPAPVYLAGMKTGPPTAKRPKASPVGQLIKHWRERRRLSQLTLAVDAEISSRHLSFIETGRAQPSRDMVLRLTRALEVPPRGRNDLLTAAGYAPVYRETALDAPEPADVRRALDFIMRQQEPFPGLVIDGHWNLLTSLGVPYDITLHELRVECFFPADAASEELLRSLARKGDAA